MNNIQHHNKCKCTCEEDAKIDIEAREHLQALYNSLGDAVNDAHNIYHHWFIKEDKRANKALKAEDYIVKAQTLLNSFAQDEDIGL